MPSRTYWLSVKSRTGPNTTSVAATAAKSSPRWAVWGPWTGPAHAPPLAPGTRAAHATRAMR
eukprot:1904029-Lingulodinium_polyedra.AAC.1